MVMPRPLPEDGFEVLGSVRGGGQVSYQVVRSFAVRRTLQTRLRPSHTERLSVYRRTAYGPSGFRKFGEPFGVYS